MEKTTLRYIKFLESRIDEIKTAYEEGLKDLKKHEEVARSFKKWLEGRASHKIYPIEEGLEFNLNGKEFTMDAFHVTLCKDYNEIYRLASDALKQLEECTKKHEDA